MVHYFFCPSLSVGGEHLWYNTIFCLRPVMVQWRKCATVNATGCVFDIHSMKLNIYISSLCKRGKVRRLVSPLDTQKIRRRITITVNGSFLMKYLLSEKKKPLHEPCRPIFITYRTGKTAYFPFPLLGPTLFTTHTCQNSSFSSQFSSFIATEDI